MKKLSLGVLVTLLVCATFAQGVSINPTGNNPDTSAMLDVGSTNKGLLLPRLTTAQRDAISLPATGLLVYNITTSTFDYYTGTVWLSLSPASSTPSVPIIRTYTSNATWTKPPGLKYIIVEMVGGGGGGSGTGSTRGNSGSGGGGGGYSKKLIPELLLQSVEIVTVGIGGSGGNSNGNPGTDGSNSSFGNHCFATGGKTGLVIAFSNGQGGAGGSGILGDININGGGGAGGGALGNTGIGITGGSGGSSFFGSNAPGSGLDSDGLNGNQFGGGGGGGSYIISNRKGGGRGGDGVVIITEHY